MAQQTRTFQAQTIKHYQAIGQLHQLYYYIEMELPSRLRPHPNLRYMPATWPVGQIPLIPLAPDPAIARDWAHLLCELFKVANPNRLILFDIALTDRNSLRDWQCYEWGDECINPVDRICPFCGMVHTLPYNVELDCGCAVLSGASALGLYRIYRAFVDDTLYTTIQRTS